MNIIQKIIDLFKRIFNINPTAEESSDNPLKRKSITDKNYCIKSFMSEYEYRFYHILFELESELNIKIHPQLNLASIVDKKENERYRNELFRNIDFAIFDNQYKKLLLLIELNDSTHNTTKRRDRDNKVRTICDSAEITLLTFYTKYPNEKEYVKSRVKKFLLGSNEENNMETNITI